MSRVISRGHSMPRRKHVQACCTGALHIRDGHLSALGAAGRSRGIASGQTVKVYPCAK